MTRRPWSLMAASLAIGLLLIAPARSWADRQHNAFRDYVVFQIQDDEVDNWDFDVESSGEVEYKCDEDDGCRAEVVTRGLSSGLLTIEYTCDDHAKIRLLQGLVIVPPACDGAVK